MTNWLRRGGRGLLPDGRTLIWSVAEGRRGQRWRSSTLDPDGSVVLALLFETDSDGRFARLEVTSRAGLLTLHPESAAARVDGNVVESMGVRPISLSWAPDHVLWVTGSPIPEILTRRSRPSGRRALSGIEIDDRFHIGAVVLAPGEGSGPASDGRGVPVLASPEEWALEP